MRVVYAVVPEGDRPAVLARLDEEGIDYVRLSEDSDSDDVVIQFPLPTPAVEEVLDELNEAGLEDEYTVVTSAESVETPNFEAVAKRYAEQEDKDIAPVELRTRALEMGPRTAIYYAMTLLSAVVAAAGLLLDAPAIVVGSMVIAPQVGSALAASVGTVFADRDMIVDGLRSQVLGLLLAVVAAAALGLVLQWLDLGPTHLPSLALEQIHQRVGPGVLSVVVAVAAGFAAALSLATAIPTSLVGVMIAAALIPAAAAVGVGAAWSAPSIAVGAAILLVVNTAAINLSGIGGLWALGYRPGDDSRLDTGSSGRRATRPALAAFVVLLLVFAGFGFLTAQHVAFEQTATDAVEETLAQSPYERLSAVSVDTQFGATAVLDGPNRVTVVVNRPAGTEFPDLPRVLHQRISARTDRPVTVSIEFRDTATATNVDSSTRLEPAPTHGSIETRPISVLFRRDIGPIRLRYQPATFR